MTEFRAEELIRKGEEYESTHDTLRFLDIISQQAVFIEVPGGADHYEIGGLRHADTRSLYLMLLGTQAELQEQEEGE